MHDVTGLRWTAILLLALGWGLVPQTPAQPQSGGADAEVAPGQVVRWSAPGTERCGLGEEEWRPMGETCWYPVDLLTQQKEITVHRRRAGREERARVRIAEYPYDLQRLEIEDDSKVHLSPTDAARAQRESRRVAALWSRRGPRRFELPLGAPLASMPLGGRFGSRRIINGEPRSPHSGADYAATIGTPVRAVAAGEVVLAEDHFFSGNSVFVDHGDGLISMYFHLSRIEVKSGQKVALGEELGKVGATGRVTGPHLHFGLRWRGARVDPSFLLQPGAAPVVRR